MLEIISKIISMNKFIYTCFLFLFAFAFSFAQKLNPTQQKKVDEIFKKGSVVYFKFPVSSAQEVTPIAKEISVDKMVGTMVFAHATKDQFSKFIVRNYPYTIERYGKSTNAKATTKAKGTSAKSSTKTPAKASTTTK